MKGPFSRNVSKFAFAVSIAAACLVLAGCTADFPTGAPRPHACKGAASVTIRTGKVGVLAKRTGIEMDKLIIDIYLRDIDSSVLRDTSGLSGHNETVVKKTFPGLTAPENFTLHARAIDKAGKVIHTGSVEFSTIPGDTIDVSLALDAQYSMLRVSFNDIPDSVSKVTLGIAGTETLDSVFTAGTRNTVVLSYDYLSARSNGIAHAISLRASGSFYGNDTVLYAADTTVRAQSGVDKAYRVVLKWVGPGVPKGAAAMTVTIGAVGTVTVNAEPEKWVPLIDEHFDAYTLGETPLRTPWTVFWSGVPAQSNISNEHYSSAPFCWKSTGQGSWARADGYPVTRKRKLKYEASVMLTNAAVPASIGFQYKISGSESRSLATAWLEGAEYVDAWHKVTGEIDCDRNKVTISVDGTTLSQYSYETTSELESRENAFTHFTISCDNGSYSTGSVLFDDVKLWYMD